jgi:membrane fusion protein, copper/silver efflux system
MKKRTNLIILAIIVTLSFLVGNWYNHVTGNRKDDDTGKKISHYVDPMHPSYTSDKPGIAPDCGMQLEPVYADGSIGSTKKEPAGLPPGMVHVTLDRQQLIGVRVAASEVAPAQRMLRFVGRAVPDETRVYVLNATIDGWITKTTQVTTGSYVKEEQVLATFYSPEFLSASSALLFALSSMDRVQAVGGNDPQNQVQKDQLAQFNVSLQQYKDSLRNLGMGRRQTEELIKNRKYTESIDITAPGAGIILTRNVSEGQRFVKGQEFFRIADLRRIWVVADVYENEADLFRPGMTVRVNLPQRHRTFTGKVSSVPPIFDPASRTLKVRIEVANPDLVLRPDMFVDVEASLAVPATLTVPLEAVLDSGLRKTVFVDRGNGYFEPRKVETGRALGDRVEIARGLMAGEKIVVSGNFLLDSEARMRQAASGITGKAVRDPVCGMDVDEERSKAAGYHREFQGKGYTFCSVVCRDAFGREPQRYAASPAPAGGMPMPTPTAAGATGRKPVAVEEHREHHSPSGEHHHD